MKIDITVPFNDVVPPKQIGMVLDNKPPYYDQVIHLVNSINTNWDTSKHEYNIHLFHSRPLEQSKKERLESLGCNVVYDSSEIQPFLNRENILKYDYQEESDYTMILDTDMLVLKTPELNLDKEIYARLSPNQGIISEQQRDICRAPAGALQISPLLRHLEKIHRHFGIQIYNSLLFKKFDWDNLPSGMNVFPSEMNVSSHQPVEILHYLGSKGLSPELRDLYSLYD